MEKTKRYTVTSLATKMGKSRPAATSLIRRMVRDNLAELAEVLPYSETNRGTKVHVYEFFIDPERYMDGVRLPEPRIPKSTHYNDPFNLGAQRGQ
jgi:Mn-dependent DtxR family transcriptional regulator